MVDNSFEDCAGPTGNIKNLAADRTVLVGSVGKAQSSSASGSFIRTYNVTLTADVKDNFLIISIKENIRKSKEVWFHVRMVLIWTESYSLGGVAGHLNSSLQGQRVKLGKDNTIVTGPAVGLNIFPKEDAASLIIPESMGV